MNSAMPIMPAPHAFHVIAKPTGPQCNLRCNYCFYLEKEALFAPKSSRRMDDEMLEAFVRQYIESQPGDRVQFAWQGGEPTLLGVPWFRNMVQLQRRHANGKTIENALQTNGTLLDDEWAGFLKEHDFLVGVSIDGPQALHDRSRVDVRREGSWASTMRGLETLERHGVAFNTLTCVSAANCEHPLEVYRFLKRIGARHLQFIPVVERTPGATSREHGLTLGMPDVAQSELQAITPWSVQGGAWGRFLIEIFDRWVRHDVGEVHVQSFDGALAKWLGMPGGLCVHNEICGDMLAIEHDGSVYACDHYVYPEFRIGNIRERPLGELAADAGLERFGFDKRDRLPEQCRRCDVLFACNGGCPKHRFATTTDGQAGLNHLCTGYRAFFRHIDPYMRRMADLVRRSESVTAIMREVKTWKTFSPPSRPTP